MLCQQEGLISLDISHSPSPGLWKWSQQNFWVPLAVVSLWRTVAERTFPWKVSSVHQWSRKQVSSPAYGNIFWQHQLLAALSTVCSRLVLRVASPCQRSGGMFLASWTLHVPWHHDTAHQLELKPPSPVHVYVRKAETTHYNVHAKQLLDLVWSHLQNLSCPRHVVHTCLLSSILEELVVEMSHKVARRCADSRGLMVLFTCWKLMQFFSEGLSMKRFWSFSSMSHLTMKAGERTLLTLKEPGWLPRFLLHHHCCLHLEHVAANRGRRHHCCHNRCQTTRESWVFPPCQRHVQDLIFLEIK